jgi:hypothetical protein
VLTSPDNRPDDVVGVKCQDPSKDVRYRGEPDTLCVYFRCRSQMLLFLKLEENVEVKTRSELEGWVLPSTMKGGSCSVS